MESLPPVHLLEELKLREAQLEQEIKKQSAFLKKAPNGFLRIKTCRGTFQYYYRKGDSERDLYIGKEKLVLKKALANKEYGEKLLPALKKEQNCIKNLIRCLDKNEVKKSYDMLKKGSKIFVTPVTLDNEGYAREWLKVTYPMKAFNETEPLLLTSSGKRVRSKSEIIIAQILDEMKVPYRYEYPLKMSGFGKTNVIVHPDFYCLNVRTRKEYVWEHFGMLDLPDYAENAVKKITLYEKNGIISGKNFIFTLETKNTPVTVDSVKKVVEEFLV